MSKKNSLKKKKIRKDCWDLDVSFIYWLKERLPVFLRDASSVVDLNYRKFIYKDKEYTQEEIIKRMIELINLMGDDYVFSDPAYIDELLDLWKLVFPRMWW